MIKLWSSGGYQNLFLILCFFLSALLSTLALTLPSIQHSCLQAPVYTAVLRKDKPRGRHGLTTQNKQKIKKAFERATDGSGIDTSLLVKYSIENSSINGSSIYLLISDSNLLRVLLINTVQEPLMQKSWMLPWGTRVSLMLLLPMGILDLTWFLCRDLGFEMTEEVMNKVQACPC